MCPKQNVGVLMALWSLEKYASTYSEFDKGQKTHPCRSGQHERQQDGGVSFRRLRPKQVQAAPVRSKPGMHMNVAIFTELMNFLLKLLGVVASCGEMKTIMLLVIKGGKRLLRINGNVER